MPKLTATAALALVLLLAPAVAHDSWISQGALRNPQTNEWCCGEGDCFVILTQFVHRVAGGFRVEVLRPVAGEPEHMDMQPEFVPDAEVSPSADDQFWRCQRSDGSRRCFFAPPSPGT